MSVYGSSLSSVRATALGTESFYLVSHIIFKAFNYTYLHNTMIMNMSHIFSYRVNLKKKQNWDVFIQQRSANRIFTWNGISVDGSYPGHLLINPRIMSIIQQNSLYFHLFFFWQEHIVLGQVWTEHWFLKGGLFDMILNFMEYSIGDTPRPQCNKIALKSPANWYKSVWHWSCRTFSKQPFSVKWTSRQKLYDNAVIV